MAISEASGSPMPDVADTGKPARSAPPPFRPFIPPEVVLPELTPLPLLMGTVLGVIFGASSLYLVLKVGLTVSASIPVAVISVTLFRMLAAMGLRRRSILENNIVQTAGSAGEGIAFGIGVTMPAVLILGFGIGWLYKTLNIAFKAWKDIPEKVFKAPFEAGSISAEISPELLGVGYIIGPRIGSIMCSGGVLAYLVLIPAIKFFGRAAAIVVPPGTVPIAHIAPDEIPSAYLLYTGSRAVAPG